MLSQSAARQLYGHIDNLELYPGLQAEDCMPLGPGSGICCGYTMTRAILGDAVALVRGDRFYTTDYTRKLLALTGVRYGVPYTYNFNSCQSHIVGLPRLRSQSRQWFLWCRPAQATVATPTAALHIVQCLRPLPVLYAYRE